MMKIFMYCYWGEEKPVRADLPVDFNYKPMLIPCLALVVLSLLMGLFSQFSVGLVTEAAKQILDPSNYIGAVLGL